MKRLFIGIFALSLALCACCACAGGFDDANQTLPSVNEDNTTTQAVTDSSSSDISPEEATISDDGTMPLHQKLIEIVPNLNNVTTVAVKVPGLIPDLINDENAYGIYAQANEVQVRQIVDYLGLLAAVEFVEIDGYEHESYLITTSPILIENIYGSCAFSIMASEDDNSPLYVVVIPNQGTADNSEIEGILSLRYFEGHAGSLPIRDLNNALEDVLLDIDVTQNVAVVQALDSDKQEYTLNKSITAVWRYITDATIRISGPVENPEEQSYDIKLVVGDTIYRLNTVSGNFSKENDGEIILGKLDEDILKWFLPRI
jgi:hypothetical protein